MPVGAGVVPVATDVGSLIASGVAEDWGAGVDCASNAARIRSSIVLS
jgi:hypothetical protein